MVFEYKQIIRFLENEVWEQKLEGQLHAAQLQYSTEANEGGRPLKMSSEEIDSLEGIRNEEKAGAGRRLSLFTSISSIS